MSPCALRIAHLIAMDDLPPLTIALTQEQQLQVLAATGLRVSTLELPRHGLEDGGEALACLSLPDWLKGRVTRASALEEVKADDPIGESKSDPD